MAKMTRRAVLAAIGVSGVAVTTGYLVRAVGSHAPTVRLLDHEGGGGMMGPGMMGGTTDADMSAYGEMFHRHREISRVVEEIPGGVRTTTESDSPALTAQLQAHVTSMYTHLDQGMEVTCMSGSLPTLFRSARSYRRQITLTPGGVVAEEVSDDPIVTEAIRAHAREVTAFVDEGMAAMMRQMMGPGGMMGPR